MESSEGKLILFGVDNLTSGSSGGAVDLPRDSGMLEGSHLLSDHCPRARLPFGSDTLSDGSEAKRPDAVSRVISNIGHDNSKVLTSSLRRYFALGRGTLMSVAGLTPVDVLGL